MWQANYKATPQAMPEFGGGPPLSHFEFWPTWLFYAPIWLWILCLMVRYRSIRLPLIANVGFSAGGLVGERKSDLFARLTGPERARLPGYVVITRTPDPARSALPQITAQLTAAGLDFPLVAKPDIGCRGAGVQPIRAAQELVRYLEDFPHGEQFLLQRMVDVEGEAGVFYVRPPGASKGRIVSLTLKYFPKVVGDGHSTLGGLIARDPRAGRVPQLYLGRFRRKLDQVLPAGMVQRLVFSGSHSKGAIFRNGQVHITPAMTARFDRIADGISGFHFGRVDVRFADFTAFQRGEDFAIIEFNGAGAEMTHIWDSRTSLVEAWMTLCQQFSLLFAIGAANRKRGARPDSWRVFLQQWQREKSLASRYPMTR